MISRKNWLALACALCLWPWHAADAKNYNLMDLASIDLPSSYKVHIPVPPASGSRGILAMAADGRRGCMIRVDSFGQQMSDEDFIKESPGEYQDFVRENLMPNGGSITHEAYERDINGMPAKTVDVLTSADGKEVPARFTAINLHNRTRLFVIELAYDPHYRVPCLKETARYVQSMTKIPN